MAISAARAAEVSKSLAEIRSRIHGARPPGSSSLPVLVAVSKYKPASDIMTCYDNGHLDFGENYVQELVEKAEALPQNIRWHFIGSMQSNKAKTLASIPNLHTVQTVNSIKAAKALNKALPDNRTSPLNVLIQINTSGEDVKSGLPPLEYSSANLTDSDLFQLANSIVTECPKLHLGGLMTIGSLERSSQASSSAGNPEFDKLKYTRDILQDLLNSQLEGQAEERWGNKERRLFLSMGMTNDFETALRVGSDIVRVGTGIFGERTKSL